MKKNIIGIAGSLRKSSYNRMILNYLTDVEHSNVKVTPHSIDEIPLFNGDLEENGDPAEVASFKQSVKEADGLLIVTPEYSHGTPGVLKNVLDWAGSMTNENVLYKKPSMIVGASPSAMGTCFSQQQIRQTLSACHAYVMPQPQVYIGSVHHKVNESGQLQDEVTKKRLNESLEEFLKWIEIMKL
ncbi:NADPH-dependent FMN reductase [Salipaludibacillus aurantiacus]|uniref:Chromate reductase n=1 Tax=Salipaludibacillus aurantiacus TaxID=1601833 RepID=A0A1H9TEH5_9BACI|nr:NADPH-dependent FMN reductase [Salipaludibacillus aurantiacus]SER95447.1 chromate reductase [Salipaludibacillus aurantiacus]